MKNALLSCADTIERANTLIMWKRTFAQSLRNGQVDLKLLEEVRLEAVNIIEACDEIREMFRSN